MVEIIKKKRDGEILTDEEIRSVVSGFVDGSVPDYQISAWLMTIFFKGLNDKETAVLTDAIMRSGDLIDLSEIPGIKVDKHSTGGVGDKTTLVLGPLVAAAGVYVPKMSGRGLGHTGGTLDKLESIPGFNTNMTTDHFVNLVKEHHIAICSQNDRLVPADKKLYALRDVTGTVDNISLIASSVMSKKLACGADAIVIDLKVGDGAFIKTIEDAEKLADIMINTAKQMNRRLIAVISSMEEPLGHNIGNALEVREAIDTLKGHGPADLTELCLTLGSYMLMMAGKTATFKEGKLILEQLLANGKAFEKLVEMTIAQGGDVDYVKSPEKLKIAPCSFEYKAEQNGYIAKLSAMDIGLASVRLGAGRETKESIIDLGAGIILKKKVGDYVEKGDTIALLYASDISLFDKAKIYMDDAVLYTSHQTDVPELILAVKGG
ncbi:MAG TPA: pyrimidine-nucleoside phosphorylase [Saprospiraceae bacterium]|nr:pyrimidine-nucleoside phosphorylase [Saprospiraceae bacterium]HRO07905.1 pyrimidine-nucleoside phosphorylase [Saprospiraceae bacterium]HRP41302.1 pyrimidine-nucleoside phosphorylase [Saprospiraceae bacterium]